MSESPVPRSDNSIPGRHVTENSVIATLPADKKLVYRLIRAMMKHELLSNRELIRIGFKGLNGYLNRLSQEQINQILLTCHAVNPEWNVQYDASEAAAILRKPYEAHLIHTEDLLRVLKQDDLKTLLTPDVTTPLVLESVINLRTRVAKGQVTPENAKAFLADTVSLLMSDLRDGTFPRAPIVLLMAVGVDAFIGQPQGVDAYKKALTAAIHWEQPVADKPNVCEFDAGAFVGAIPTEMWAALSLDSLWNVLDLLPGALGLNEAPISDHATVPPPAVEVQELELEDLTGQGLQPHS